MPAPVRITRKGNATTISMDGPFFTKDPAKRFSENLDAMLEAVAREAASDVRAQVEARRSEMKRSTGWSATRIAPRSNFPWREHKGFSLVWTSTQGLTGRADALKSSGTIWKGNMAMRTLAAMSTIEGRWHPFRITKNRILKMRKLNQAELTKGLQ